LNNRSTSRFFRFQVIDRSTFSQAEDDTPIKSAFKQDRPMIFVAGDSITQEIDSLTRGKTLVDGISPFILLSTTSKAEIFQ
jgi:hypothetical protein